MKEFQHLKTGWEDENFERNVRKAVRAYERNGWKYFDIKISSKGNNCLLIFEKEKT